MAHRLFVAVRPPGDVLDAVERCAQRVKRAMVGPRWATRDQWHLTLQFLGPVEEDAVDDVGRALESVSSVQPFPLMLGGGGAFPRATRARVVWLGVCRGEDAMAGLAGAVHRALAPLHFEPEERDFTPHLTLARLRNPGDVTPVVEVVGDEPVGPAFTVNEVVLYESRRRKDGSVYEPLAQVALEG